MSSPDLGLLLGMYFSRDASGILQDTTPGVMWVPENSPEPHGTYLTFWITRTHGHVKIQFIDGLLLPRADGFWRVGSQIVQSKEEADFDFDEQFWAVAASQKPALPKIDPDIDGKSVRVITYLGREYLSYLFHWQGGAGLWQYQFPHVDSLDDLKTDLSVSRVLGAQAGSTYKKLAKSLDHMLDEVKPGEDRGSCNCCTGSDNEWGIIHFHDSWHAYARFHSGTSSSCEQDWEDHVLHTTIPQSLWSGGRSHQPWNALRKELEALLGTGPGSVQHLFLSPKLDFAVVITTAGLAVLEIRNAQFSVIKKLSFDAPCLPISEQWSIGRFVAVWNEEVQKQPPATIPKLEYP